MAIGELISENLSTLIEIVTLVLIVLGFFRWYDAKYTRTVKTVGLDFESRLTQIQMSLNRLDDRLHDYIMQQQHQQQPYHEKA